MPQPSLPRRTTVGVAGVGLLAAGVAGCGAEAAGRRAPTAADPDTDVVEQARSELAQREALVVRTMRRHPPLRARLRPLLTLHRRHQEVLSPTGAREQSPAPPAVPRDEAAALALVLRQEQGLQGELTILTIRARSGALARVLAGMAAGTAQRVALLERVDPT